MSAVYRKADYSLAPEKSNAKLPPYRVVAQTNPFMGRFVLGTYRFYLFAWFAAFFFRCKNAMSETIIEKRVPNSELFWPFYFDC